MRWFKVFFLLFIVSILGGLGFLHSYEKKHERYLMFFKNKITNETQIENRYIVLDSDKESLNCFVEEFLLGPTNHQLRSFFPSGMKCKSLFVRDDILYLDLPRDSLLYASESFEDFYNLFRKSLKLNFPSIKDTYVSIEGVQVYEREFINSH